MSMALRVSPLFLAAEICWAIDWRSSCSSTVRAAAKSAIVSCGVFEALAPPPVACGFVTDIWLNWLSSITLMVPEPTLPAAPRVVAITLADADPPHGTVKPLVVWANSMPLVFIKRCPELTIRQGEPQLGPGQFGGGSLFV